MFSFVTILLPLFFWSLFVTIFRHLWLYSEFFNRYVFEGSVVCRGFCEGALRTVKGQTTCLFWVTKLPIDWSGKSKSIPGSGLVRDAFSAVRASAHGEWFLSFKREKLSPVSPLTVHRMARWFRICARRAVSKPPAKTRKGFGFRLNPPETRKGFGFGLNPSEAWKGFGFGLKPPETRKGLGFGLNLSAWNPKGFGVWFKPPCLKPERVWGLV